jgi:hypothetical protein
LFRFLLCAAGILACSPAGAESSLEYAVKAAYLIKFVPFIEWPEGVFASATAPITLCILGNDPFGATLDKAAANGAGGRPIAIRRIAAVEAAAGCQIIYSGDPLAEPLGTLRDKPVVTVTESGITAGGVISFVVLDNHVRFDIDDAAAAQGGVRISSKLLELAHVVNRREAGQ